MRKTLMLRAVALAVTLLASGAASADDATDIAAARSLGQDGVVLADQGKCAAAIEKLERAEKLHHAPTTALRLAECEIDVGRIVSGTERLERLLREPQPASAPPAFVAAVAKADKVLAAARPRIASLRIGVVGPKASVVTVAVDNEPVPSVLIDGDRPTDPGPRHLTAIAKGWLPAASNVTLKEGETSSVTLTLQRDPNFHEAPPVVVGELPGPEGGRRGPNLLAWTALGVGVVGLAVGAIGGGITASKTSSLDGQCVNKACPPSAQSDIDAASTWSTVSTVGFIVGGAAVATSVVLFVIGRPQSAQRAKTTPSVTPIMGATWLGLDGSF